MKEVVSILKNYKKEAVLAPLFKMFEATMELLVPFVVASIVDVGIANGDKPHVYKMCLVLVAFGVLGMLFAFVAQYFSAKAAVGVAHDLRGKLFLKLNSLSYSEYDRLGTSTMITRMTSDVNSVQTGVNLALRLLLRSPFIVFGALVAAIFIDAQLAKIVLFAIVLLCAVVFGVMLVSIPLYKKSQAHLDSVVLSVRENLSGARVLRAFCREEDEATAFRKKNTALYRSQTFVGRISALTNPITFVIVNLAIVGLIGGGAIRVNVGTLTQGEVIALYNILSQILIELIKMANLIVTLTKAVASGKRIEGVFALESSLKQGSACEGITDAPAIAFDRVSLRYQTAGDYSLSDVSFLVERGQTLGIIGGTGSGKTSLINLIPHFYDATDGAVIIDGVNVQEYDAAALRQKIGIVEQRSVLFSGTIADNLRWGNGSATDAELLNAIKIAQATDVLTAKGGLDAPVGQGGKNLSGGQRQRLCIARALVRKPKILILDDSSSALDYATDLALRKALRTLDYKPTVVIVSQRTSSIRHADKIVVLDNGKVVGIGNHESLLADCPIYAEIDRTQTEV